MKDAALKTGNVDLKTVEGFGKEWGRFTQREMSDAERAEVFSKYFSLIDWSRKPSRALDMGCGSGRWDILVAPLVAQLVAADASPEALLVARRNVELPNVSFVEATAETLPFPDGYFDFIFSLGVLHHVPDTQGAIDALTAKLSSGGALLLYLYYAFDTRPGWFKMLWKISDWIRRLVCRLPFPLRYGFSQVVAVFVYWPLARTAKYLPVPEPWPLKIYANRSFYIMRTGALDRFGTRLEKRFTQKEITAMLERAGLKNVRFSEGDPYWVCVATKP